MRALAVALMAVCTTFAEAASALEFSPAERRRIEQLGPWPPPAAFDAGNAQAGRPDAIAFGQRLFFDPRLSPDGRFACASCHVPAQAFADAAPRGQGREALARNTPSLWNAVHERWYGWDGAFDSLWSQALQPLRAADEMGASARHISHTVRADPDLSCRYRRVFGNPPPGDDEATLVDVAKALGAFVGSLVSARTPFDDFRDALLRDDKTAAAPYPADAQRGLRLFIGRGQCSTCHLGPMLSNGEFGDTGLPFFVRPGVVDPGRHAGIAALRANPHNLLSRWADAPARGAGAVKTRHVEPQPRNFGEFKVPSLRNVALTAPYMHDGQIATLAGVVRHYSELNLERLHSDGEQILKPLRLSDSESADLVAFLDTLSDPRALQWRAPDWAPCDAAGP